MPSAKKHTAFALLLAGLMGASVGAAQDGALIDTSGPPAIAMLSTAEETITQVRGVNSFDGSPVTHQSQFAIASIGKTMTAVAILQQATLGQIDLNAPAARWLDESSVAMLGGLEDVTVWHLLTMRSGLPDYYTDTYLDDALAEPERVQTPGVALSYVADAGEIIPPGDSYEYSNTNYVLLQLILEAVTGETMALYFNRHIFTPAGMTGSVVFGSEPLDPRFVTGDDSGEPVRDYYAHTGLGDGGVLATAPDLIRFYRALFTDKILLPEPMLSLMLSDPEGDGYGAGIAVEETLVGHSGSDLGFSSDIAMDRVSEAIAVILIAEGNSEESNALSFLD